jgi:hypothetical protein
VFVRTAGFPHRLKPEPWPVLHDRYAEVSARSPSMSFMLRIVESIEESGCADAIAGATSIETRVIDVECPG